MRISSSISMLWISVACISLAFAHGEKPQGHDHHQEATEKKASGPTIKLSVLKIEDKGGKKTVQPK